MNAALRIVAFAAALLSLARLASPRTRPPFPKPKQTTLGLYLTSEEVPPFLAQRGGHSLFVDVRTPEELASSGVATTVDANVPLLLAFQRRRQACNRTPTSSRRSKAGWPPKDSRRMTPSS